LLGAVGSGWIEPKLALASMTTVEVATGFIADVYLLAHMPASQ
jgi:hypothetical protein